MALSNAIGIPEKIFSFLRFFSAAATVALSAGCIFLSLTRSRAGIDYSENTIPSLLSSVRLDPSNALAHLALGVQLDLGGRDPESEFRAAARLDPFWSEPWHRLGLLAESRGDFRSAAQCLLHAAELNHLLEPRFTLMGFYVRRREPERFWHWARLAFERAQADPAPLFDLCWQMAADPYETYDKAIPRSHDILASYLSYLVAHGRLSAAFRPGRDLLTLAVPGDREVLLTYADSLIDFSPTESLHVWNEVCRRGLLPYSPIDPEHAPALVNPTFKYPPVSRAFDWKMCDLPQVATAQLPDGGVEFSFDGRQPEVLEMLSQTVPLVAGRKYRIALEYRTERIEDPSGILLIIEDRKAGPPIASAPIAASQTGRATEAAFDCPASSLISLHLRYQRPLGMSRTEGTLTLRKVELGAVR